MNNSQLFSSERCRFVPKRRQKYKLLYDRTVVHPLLLETPMEVAVYLKPSVGEKVHTEYGHPGGLQTSAGTKTLFGYPFTRFGDLYVLRIPDLSLLLSGIQTELKPYVERVHISHPMQQMNAVADGFYRDNHGTTAITTFGTRDGRLEVEGTSIAAVLELVRTLETPGAAQLHCVTCDAHSFMTVLEQVNRLGRLVEKLCGAFDAIGSLAAMNARIG